MGSLESEVKFLLGGKTAVRDRLLALGATLKKERVFERNVRFDTPDEQLLQRWELLRLRQDTAVRLTFKAPTAADAGSQVKVMEELEVSVSDFATLAHILRRLGFVETQVYEKWRETFELGGVEVVVDELPFGDFVELEGAEADIVAVAQQLGLDWEQRIVTNYLRLMGELKQFHRLDFDDITFANFEQCAARVVDLPTYAFADG